MGLFDKISEAVDKVTDAISDNVVPSVLSAVEPKVKTEVAEAVTEFREFVDERVPRKAAEEVKEREGSDNIATKVVAKALSGKADDLAAALLKFLKPQVDNATRELPDDLTSKCMEQLRDFLTDDDDEAKQQQEGGGGGGDGAGTRDLSFGEGGGDGDGDGGSGGGILSGVGKALNLDARLPRLRQKILDKIQPTIDALKGSVWEKMPGIFKDAVADLLVDGSDEEGGDGGIDWVPDALEKKIKGKVIDKVPDLVESLERPIREVIDDVAEFLQKTVADKVEAQLRSVLETLHLL